MLLSTRKRLAPKAAGTARYLSINATARTLFLHLRAWCTRFTDDCVAIILCTAAIVDVALVMI